jgi:hypothetical protein
MINSYLLFELITPLEAYLGVEVAYIHEKMAEEEALANQEKTVQRAFPLEHFPLTLEEEEVESLQGVAVYSLVVVGVVKQPWAEEHLIIIIKSISNNV